MSSPSDLSIPGALLIRVSTSGQAKEGRYGIDAQRTICREYAAKNNITILKEYVDVVSGSSETREQLELLVKEAAFFRVAVVYHSDRIARDVEYSHRFLRQLQNAGLEVHAANRGVVKADLLFAVESAVAADGRKRIVDRMHAGLVAKARAGKVPTNIQLYGYRDVPGTGRVVIDPDQAEVIRYLFDNAAQGDSYHELARKLNALPERRLKGGAEHWYPGHLARFIRQPAYKGEYYWPQNSKREVSPILITVPAIVDADTWAKAQRRKVGKPPRTDRPLVGHLRCGWCGASISSTIANRGKNHIYRCNSKIKGNYGLTGCKLPVKHGPTLERLVERAVRDTLTDETRVAEILAAVTPPEDPNARERAELADRDKRWLGAFQAGAINAAELGEYRAEIRAELRALAVPVQEHTFPLAEYAEAARTLPLKELLEYARVTVVVTLDRLEVTLGTAL